MSKKKSKVASESKAHGPREVEADWGNPKKSQAREVFHKGEIPVALMWLSLAALVSLVIEVVFLGTWVTIGSVTFPLPWTIVAAYVMNLILTNTALLWQVKREVAMIPTAVWLVGFGILLFWTALPFGGDQVLGSWLRTVVLLAAGAFGGLWPLRHARINE